MPITEYFQESNQIIYRMDDLRHPGNTIDMPAVDVLALDPLLVELFNYKARHTENSSKGVTYSTPNHMEQQSIVDRLEVGHYGTALELIQGMLAANKKPPYSLLLALFNLVLTPVQSKTKERRREHWAACQKAYKILLDVLRTHGAASIRPIFNEFQSINLMPAREYKLLLNDRYEMLETKILGKYTDFWEYAKEVLSMQQRALETVCHRWALDILIQTIQSDLLTKLGDEEDVKHSLLVNTMNNGRSRRLQRFDAYLQIILLDLSDTHQDYHNFSQKIINMFITIACFEETFAMDHLVSHSLTLFEKMNARDGLRFLELIEYPSFTILLGDKMFDKCNHSHVPNEYRRFRGTKHVPHNLHKLIFYVFSILPSKPYTLDSILCHVQLVLKYCNSVFATCTLQHIDTALASSALSSETLSLWNQHKEAVSSKWKADMEALVAEFANEKTPLKEKIGFCIRLTQVSFCTYSA